MGANAVTTVPVYTAGEVLTAADMNITNSGIPVFATTTTRDAAFGGAGEKTLAEGQFAYIEATNTTQYYDGAAWQSVGVSPGMILTGSASPSVVSTISINNCFSSTYENYRIVGSFTATSGTGGINARLRASGTDTTTNYTSQNTEGYSSSVVTTFNYVGTDEWYIGDIGSNLATSFAYDIYRPQTAQKTSYSGTGLYVSTAGTLITQMVAGVQSATTQFDGITIYTTSPNITGTIRVYGYANS